MIKPPFNYTGNKNRLIEEFSDNYFPKDQKLRFIDVFGGGATVSINVNYNEITYNDINDWVVNLLKLFKRKNIDEILSYFNTLLKKYNLSSTHLFGNAAYKRDGNNGLKTINEIGFKKLRENINEINESDEKLMQILFLSFYSFNNDIRFNGRGEVNIPIGKTDFNTANYNKLVTFIDALKRKKVKISKKSFEKIDINKYDFFYLDPPYLGTDAVYNKEWNEKQENTMYEFMEKIDSSKKEFVLSNMSWRKGKENKKLINFAKKNNFEIHDINFSYKASSYNRNRNEKDQEVIITNVKRI